MDDQTWRELTGLYGPIPSTQWSTALGPDYPEGSGDRERGKFRKGGRPRLTAVAVVNDDGSAIAGAGLDIEEETLLELKAIRIGIQFMLAEFSAQWAGVDLRSIAVSE